MSESILEMAQRLYKEHMQSAGYLGDDWATLRPNVAAYWRERAYLSIRKAVRKAVTYREAGIRRPSTTTAPEERPKGDEQP